MRKKLLIVGAGNGQLPAFEAAKKLGLYVLTVDRDLQAPGMERADEFFCIDTTDKNAVLALAKTKKINGIITLQSDHGVPTVGYVNDSLGLRGVSYESAVKCSLKNECRRELKNKNCSQPEFSLVENLSQAEKASLVHGFPCVVKAPDSSGSRGVTKVSRVEEVANALETAFYYSNQTSVIVEEYIEGIEFGAQTFSREGKCEIVLLHNDTLSAPPFMIPVGHSFPFRGLTPTQSAEAKIKIAEAVEAIGVANGPCNVDLILDKHTEKVNVIEIGARIGATCLPELVKIHSGIDWVSESIKCAIGDEFNLVKTKNQPVAAIILEAPISGIYKGYKKMGDFGGEDLIEYEITSKEGDLVEILRKGTDRIGKIITTGKDVMTAEKNALKYRGLITYWIE